MADCFEKKFPFDPEGNFEDVEIEAKNGDLQSWTKYLEQTSILKKSFFSSLSLSNNVDNVDKIHAGLAQLQHC